MVKHKASQAFDGEPGNSKKLRMMSPTDASTTGNTTSEDDPSVVDQTTVTNVTITAATNITDVPSVQSNSVLPKKASLMGIPIVLRRKVYSSLLRKDTPIPLSTYTRYMRYPDAYHHRLRGKPELITLPGILLVCKLVTEEALDVLYGENTFNWLIRPIRKFYLASKDPLGPFSVRNRVRIRRLTVQIPDFSGGSTLGFNNQAWLPVLANVVELRIIVQGPSLGLGSQVLRKLHWEKMLGEALKYFDDHVVKDVVIEVEDYGIGLAAGMAETFLVKKNWKRVGLEKEGLIDLPGVWF